MKNKLFDIYEILKEYVNDKEDICNELIKVVSENLKFSQDEVNELIWYLDSFESVEELLIKDENIFCDKGVFEGKMLDYFNKKEAKEKVAQVLKTLTEREERVLLLRFGIIDGRQRTLEEVGNEFNVTRERIRQIEKKALKKLRHPSRLKILKPFIGIDDFKEGKKVLLKKV